MLDYVSIPIAGDWCKGGEKAGKANRAGGGKGRGVGCVQL